MSKFFSRDAYHEILRNPTRGTIAARETPVGLSWERIEPSRARDKPIYIEYYIPYRATVPALALVILCFVSRVPIRILMRFRTTKGLEQRSNPSFER